jgi:XTP/dITP diphosphohydrolase
METHSPLVLDFATANKGKFEEAEAVCKEFNVEVRRVDLKATEIQSENLEEIAVRALENALQKTETPIFVEDAGLFVEALNGFPGPYSSYAFKTIGIDGLLKLLQGSMMRKANFASAIALGYKRELLRVFTAETEGIILPTSRGNQGFGFDPVFQPVWIQKTFAEMNLKEKNVYSHRAKCIKKMVLWYQNWVSEREMSKRLRQR